MQTILKLVTGIKGGKTTTVTTGQKQPHKPSIPPKISTVSGIFYSGMTADLAKQNDLYKKLFGRDFTDIDTNNNGKLEPEEICNERKREVKRSKIVSGMFGVGAAACYGVGAATTEFGIGVAGLAMGATGQAIAQENYGEAQRLQKITDNYRKKYLNQ